MRSFVRTSTVPLVLLVACAPGTASRSTPAARGAPAAAAPASDAGELRWSPSLRGLRLGVAVRGDRAITVLENVGDSPLTVVAAGGLSIRLEGGGTSRELFLGKDPVRLDRPETFVSLAPKARLERAQDLTDRRAVPPGRYEAIAVYASVSARVGPWWQGRLEAGPVVVDLD